MVYFVAEISLVRESYSILFAVCVSLTNFNLSMHPLHESDGQIYSVLRKRILSIGEEISRKCKMVQKKTTV